MLRLAPWLAALAFSVLVALKFDPAHGFAGLIRFGATWADRQLPVLQTLQPPLVPESAGYDGQFYAQIALAPTLRDPDLPAALDNPAYRARRILLPAVAHVLGLGRPGAIVQAYALLNVLCWFALGWLLLRRLPPENPANVARWLGCMLSMGVLDSVRQSLVDLPVLLLLYLALEAGRNSSRLTALWLAVGNLAKETNLLAAAAMFAEPHGRDRTRRAIALACSALPLFIWSLYVAHRFGANAGTSGLGNFTWPLWGAVAQLGHSATELLSGNLDSRHLFAVLAIPSLYLQAWVLLRLRVPTEAWWRVGLAYGALLLFLGEWVWSGYWAACRAVLPLTIAFNLLLPVGRGFWLLWSLGNITLLHAIWRLL